TRLPPHPASHRPNRRQTSRRSSLTSWFPLPGNCLGYTGWPRNGCIFVNEERQPALPSRVPARRCMIIGRAGITAMALLAKELYHSPNGDRWYLARDPDTRRGFVRHQTNMPSGGDIADVDVVACLIPAKVRSQQE